MAYINLETALELVCR